MEGMPLQYEEFLRRVADQIGADRAEREAERAIPATLETLGERLSGGEASNLVAQLPGGIKETLQQAGGVAEGFSLEEFYRRVADREGVDAETARNDASAVMRVLREAVSPGELDDVMAQLPAEFNALFR